MTRPIIDPRFMDEMANYFPSLCTIQKDVGTVDDHGMPIEDWQDVAGHVDIPCAHGPSKGTEVKRPDQTYVVSNYTLSLEGYYPLITEKMRSVVTGPNSGTYEILLAQSSSHGVTTRVLTRKVT